MKRSSPELSSTRRCFLGGMTLAAAALAVPGAFAEELTRTAAVEEGPFYPTRLPLDTDNDLLIVNDSITPAVGEITHLGGRLLDAQGHPIQNALIEIWQVDHSGTYLEQRVRENAPFDDHFQGFGRFLTGSSGEYYFRTIKPVRYPGRQAPHIHFKIKLKGQEPWTTQLFIQGFSGNMQDGVYRGIGDTRAQETVTVPFVPVAGSRIGELAAKFDIIRGFTITG
jgi:protocatechuate 3,4-dioxygenase beta subunit